MQLKKGLKQIYSIEKLNFYVKFLICTHSIDKVITCFFFLNKFSHAWIKSNNYSGEYLLELCVLFFTGLQFIKKTQRWIFMWNYFESIPSIKLFVHHNVCEIHGFIVFMNDIKWKCDQSSKSSKNQQQMTMGSIAIRLYSHILMKYAVNSLKLAFADVDEPIFIS